MKLIDLFVGSKLCNSKAEFKRLLKAGVLTVNGEYITKNRSLTLKDMVNDMEIGIGTLEKKKISLNSFTIEKSEVKNELFRPSKLSPIIIRAEEYLKKESKEK